MAGRRMTISPRDPHAAPVCLLTREWAVQRDESPDVFLGTVLSELPADRGIEYRLSASAEIWGRVETFIQEEGECCPFLAFEAEEEADQIRLKVIWPEEALN